MAKRTPASPTLAALPDDRDASADDRDRTAGSHDATANERDELAQLRDARDNSSGKIDAEAASDRNAARRDRLSAKGDRGHARDDRQAAWTDRSLSADQRATLLLDELTGSYRRAAGFLELEREIIKAERTNHQFVLAFIDVDNLKVLNDTQGHDAGDQLLTDVVRHLRGVVRDYDVIVRYGGDEFICGLADLNIEDATVRLEQAKSDLGANSHASISVGFAQRDRGEGLASLIGRADSAMYASRLARASVAETHPSTEPQA